ncbi:MAG: tetratricopeptide repeat protein, partial [Myxococcaceae bacterium]
MRRSCRQAGVLLGLALAGCATTPEKAPPAATKPSAETPEVPYQPRPAAAAKPPPPTDPAVTSASGGATVVKTVPAPPSEVTAAPAEAPPPPKATTDPQTLAAFRRGIEASNNGDVLTAERELKEVVGRDGTLDYAWTNLGVLYERQALPDQAEGAYKKAIALKPDQALAWDYLTRLYCRSGRAPEIEGQLRTGIQDHPAALGLRTALVYSLIYQGKFEPASSEAKKVLKADERNVKAMQLLAQVYYREKKNELAKMVLENARAIDPNDAATQNELGLVNLALKARTQALENFRQAATLKPDFAEAKNNYGALLNESQDYDGAVRELEGAVNAAPDFIAARLNLGNAYRGKQEFAKAISQYKQVLRLKPE